MINTVVLFLFKEIPEKNILSENGNPNKKRSQSASSCSPIRLLSPLSVFCTFLTIHPSYIDFNQSVDDYEAIRNDFIMNFCLLLNLLNNHMKKQSTLSLEESEWKTQVNCLREGIELRGFLPLIDPNHKDYSMKYPFTSSSSLLSDNKATIVRIYRIFELRDLLIKKV